MAQPTYSDVHVSAALTDVSVAYFQDNNNYVADKVFPIVPVQHQANKYFVWSKSDFFRDVAQKRADGTESAGGGFGLTTQSYSADVWAYHKDVGEQVRNNADPAIDIDTTTTEGVTQVLMIRRENAWAASYFKTGVWGTDLTPANLWSDDANGDPISDIATAQTTIMQNTGFKPNTLTLGWPVYQALRKHPLIVDRIKFTTRATDVTINEELLAQLFDVERVLVAKAVYNNAAEGATDSFSFALGKNALLTYAPSAPALNTPSAGYTFAWTGFTGLNNFGIRVSQIPMPWLGLGTTRIEGEMAFDLQVVAAALGYFFNGAVA